MTYSLMVEDVLRYADEAKIEKFDFLGHSLGGKVAMQMALRHPDRIRSVITLEAAPKDLSKEEKIKANTLNCLERLLSVKIQGLTRRGAIDELMSEFKD
jgi:esterase